MTRYAIHRSGYNGERLKLRNVILGKPFVVVEEEYLAKVIRIIEKKGWKKDVHSKVWNKGHKFLTVRPFEGDLPENVELNVIPSWFPKRV
jgi:hypothetical protein